MRYLLLLFLSSQVFAATEIKRLVIIGDSLTEGYGVSREQAYPALLQKKIENKGKSWKVVNAGVSGATSASALSRVQWHLKQKPELLVIALGANDGLRGLSVKSIEQNLEAAIKACQAAKVKVALAGMRMPPNYGTPYATQFAQVFKRVADKTKIPFIPFMLEKVAGRPEFNLSDGIHPNEKGHELIADYFFKSIEASL